jgi:hypothetical protein
VDVQVVLVVVCTVSCLIAQRQKAKVMLTAS